MNAILHRYDSWESWLSGREADDGIGATTAAAILGLSPYRTPWEVWARKWRPDFVPERTISPQDSRRGLVLEEAVLRLYAAEVAPVESYDCTIAVHPTLPWVRMSPDGIRPEDGEPVEAKTSRFYAWPESGEIRLDDAPSRGELWGYVAQAMWEAVVLEADRAHIAALIGGLDLRVYTVATPAGLRHALIDRVGEWRERHLIRGEEPEQGRPIEVPRGWEASARDLPTSELPEADDDMWTLVQRWTAAREAVAVAKADADAATEALAQALDAAALTGVRRGKACVRWQVTAPSERVASLSKLDPETVAILRERGAITTTAGSRHLRASGF